MVAGAAVFSKGVISMADGRRPVTPGEIRLLIKDAGLDPLPHHVAMVERVVGEVGKTDSRFQWVVFLGQVYLGLVKPPPRPLVLVDYDDKY